jgi:glutaminase
MEFMKPETLEAIKKEVEMSPVEWLEKEVKKRFGGETFTSVFSVEFERSKKMENDIIEGATKYAERLESEREKSEKLCEAVKSLLLICGHPTSEIYEDAKKVFDEYKTTSK